LGAEEWSIKLKGMPDLKLNAVHSWAILKVNNTKRKTIRDNSFIEIFLNPARVLQMKLPPYQEFTTKRFGQRRTLLLQYTHVIEIS